MNEAVDDKILADLLRRIIATRIEGDGMYVAIPYGGTLIIDGWIDLTDDESRVVGALMPANNDY